jgi:queuine tRNA-ribosyltransferase
MISLRSMVCEILREDDVFKKLQIFLEKCSCFTCKNYSRYFKNIIIHFFIIHICYRSYLHHLFKARESVGGTLGTIHNLHFMQTMLATLRQEIIDDKL